MDAAWRTLKPGLILAQRYLLKGQLGAGGMGVVWAATHTLTGRAVALKFLRPALASNGTIRRRFVQEARAATALQHSNVVEVLDMFELESGIPVIVMDLLQGETLRARLEREGRLSSAATASVLLPVVAAVEAAHSRGIVHRDLKPDNIFLTARPASGVKVLDFGIAKLMGSDALEEPAVTATGTTLGTPCYMAPEQALGERNLDHRVDVWALGAIAYECLAGERAIKGASLGQVVLQHNGPGIRPLAQLAPNLPLDLCRLVEQMTARMRADRPASLDAVRGVLARYTEADASVLGSPQAPDPYIGAERAGDGAGARAASPEQPGSTHPVTVTLQYRVKRFVPGVAWLLGALTVVFAVQFGLRPRTQPASAPRRAAVLAHDSSIAVRPAPKIASGADSTATQHGGPLGAGEPYLTGKACEACVSASCAEAAVHCGSDANCSSWLAHTRAHPDPAGLLERSVHPVEHGNIAINAAQWNSMHGATTAADAWFRLGDCARDHCLKECQTGRVFGCVGAFDYTRTFPRRVHVRVRVTNGFDQDVGLSGWAVSVCGPLDLRCKAPLATARTNSAGFLELDARLPSMSTTLPELNGYFLMDGGPKFLPLKVEGTPPILDGTLLHIPQVTANAVESFYEAEGKVMNRELGLLGVSPFDCLGNSATNVTVDVWVNHAERYDRCDGICGVVYPNDTGVPDRSRRQLSGRATQAFVHGVPAREVAVVVRDSQTARLVGIERVIVRSGYVHALLIYPPSRAQFADIPDVMR